MNEETDTTQALGGEGGPLPAPSGASHAEPEAAQAVDRREEGLADDTALGAQPKGGDSIGPVRPRRKRLPLVLFLLTCMSTFWVGCSGWYPEHALSVWLSGRDPTILRRVLLTGWQDGLVYMTCLLGILLMHEMGHFVATLRYRIPASFPFFLPLPVSLLGTMGAVIGMDGRRADRREMFDIGLAGPIAGLLVAIPVMWVGISRLDFQTEQFGPYALEMPLLVRMIVQLDPPSGYEPGALVWFSQLNPYFMAGWVGLLVTGLNMLPVSQLDGGHVIYALFGKRSKWIAWGFVIAAATFIFVNGVWMWGVMLMLVLLIGPAHPPTRDDSARLGPARVVLGTLSLAIAPLCFAPNAITFTSM